MSPPGGEPHPSSEVLDSGPQQGLSRSEHGPLSVHESALVEDRFDEVAYSNTPDSSTESLDRARL